MKMIDVDVLKATCGEWYTEEGTEEGFIGTLGQLLDNAPTIDAIPVEWLKGLMLSTEDDVDKVEFAWIMREWESEKNEHEAR